MMDFRLTQVLSVVLLAIATTNAVINSGTKDDKSVTRRDASLGVPSDSYGAPPPPPSPQSFAGIQQNYGPPQAYQPSDLIPPSASYGAPLDSYGPPKSNYKPLKPDYGPPKPEYGAPLPPRPVYGPPSGPPNLSYGVPSVSYAKGPPGVPSPPTPPHISYHGWQPIPGLSIPYVQQNNEHSSVGTAYGPPLSQAGDCCNNNNINSIDNSYEGSPPPASPSYNEHFHHGSSHTQTLSNLYKPPPLVPDSNYGPLAPHKQPSSSYGPPLKPDYGPPPKPEYGPPPSGSYGPPSKDSYGPPASGSYSPPPKDSYGPPPSGSYGPPPSGSYGPPPKNSYGPPSSGFYGKPSKGLFTSPPKESYGPPPKDTYGPPPKDSYGPPPKDSYGPPPKESYGPPPKDSYGPPPKDSYGPPQKESYGPPPKESYGPPPKDSYGPPPKESYGSPPKDSYGPPPKESYGPPPKDSYGPPPKESYGPPPKESYGPPPKDSYGPPPKESYGPPPKDSYGPPPKESYGPPPKDSYGPPPKDSYGPPPSGSYGPPPSGSYGPPSKLSYRPHNIKDTYGPPQSGSYGQLTKGSYGPPAKDSYGPPPKESYGPPPKESYGTPPKDSYGPPPKESYGIPPKDSYGPPPKESYGPPSKDSYGPPPKGSYSSPPKDSYGPPPSGSYGPPQSGSYGPPPSGSYGPPPSGSYGPPSSGYYGPPSSGSHGTPSKFSYLPPTPKDSYGLPPPKDTYGIPSLGSIDNSLQTQYDTSISSNNGLPPEGTFGIPLAICCGTPPPDLVSQKPTNPDYGLAYGQASGRQIPGPNLQPRNPVKNRPPVPPGLVESTQYNGFQGEPYIPPPVPDLPSTGNDAYAAPSTSSTYSSSGSNPIVSQNQIILHDQQQPATSNNEQYNQPNLPTPESYQHVTHSVSVNNGDQQPNIFIQQNQPLLSNIDSYGPPQQSFNLNQNIEESKSNTNQREVETNYQQSTNNNYQQQDGVNVNDIVNSLGLEGSSVIGSKSVDFHGPQEYPVQGSTGNYMLQIQPGQVGTENIAHDQVLSNGLLQDILSAIENQQKSDNLYDSQPQGSEYQQFTTIAENNSTGRFDDSASKKHEMALFYNTKDGNESSSRGTENLPSEINHLSVNEVVNGNFVSYKSPKVNYVYGDSTPQVVSQAYPQQSTPKTDESSIGSLSSTEKL